MKEIAVRVEKGQGLVVTLKTQEIVALRNH